VWDAGRSLLWWTDIDGRAIWRYDPATRNSERFSPPDRVGFLAIATGGRVLFGTAKALYMAIVANGALQTQKLADVEPDNPRTRSNDGRPDRFGNVVFGTMDDVRPRTALGSFYQFSSQHGLRRLPLPNCTVANSICFSPDGRVMYFADTPTNVIRYGAYDPEAATVTRIRDLVTLGGAQGHPDGSTIDADGCLWSAAWGGAMVRRFMPDGRLDREVTIPAKNPTCPTFGGADLSTLFVTSSRQQHTPDELANSPHAGGVFAVQFSDVRGIADTPFV
jgi:sugar lactone lactonase YvrE